MPDTGTCTRADLERDATENPLPTTPLPLAVKAAIVQLKRQARQALAAEEETIKQYGHGIMRAVHEIEAAGG